MSPRQTRQAWNDLVAALYLTAAFGIAAAIATDLVHTWLNVGSLGVLVLALTLTVADLGDE